MNNYICPACNKIFEASYLADNKYIGNRYYHYYDNPCRIILYVQNNIDFCINDKHGIYVKYNLSYNQNSVIEYDSQKYDLGFQIDNLIEAYKALIKFKENMLFL